MADPKHCAKCNALCGQVPALEKSDVVPLLLPIPGARRPKILHTEKEIERAIDAHDVQFAACLCTHTEGDDCDKGKCKCINYSMNWQEWSKWYNIVQVKKEFRNCVNKARKSQQGDQLADTPMVTSSITTNAHYEREGSAGMQEQQVPCP